MYTLLHTLLIALLTLVAAPSVSASEAWRAATEEMAYCAEELSAEMQEQGTEAEELQGSSQFQEDYLEFEYANDEGLYSRRFRLSQEDRSASAPVLLSAGLPVLIYAYSPVEANFSEDIYSRGYLSVWYPILFRYTLF